MQLDVKKFEIEDSRFSKTPENYSGESALQRLNWAINTVKDQHECFERLLIDLKQSMDAVSIPNRQGELHQLTSLFLALPAALDRAE